jgi:endonuclease I
MSLAPLRRPLFFVAVLLLAGSFGTGQGSAAGAQAAITVAEALDSQGGATATVRGYVVGQPTGTATVISSGFPNDRALALAATPQESDTDHMLYVQITSSFRTGWGLASNPDLLGAEIEVTGSLTSYFSHGGLKNPLAFTVADGTGPPPGGGGGTSPYDTTYYAAAMGRTGSALRDALHDIISDHDTLTYSQVWSALRHTDADPSNPNNVLTLYSGLSLPGSGNGGGADDWNREHVWPQSHGGFGTAVGPGTDIHHLRPEDVSVNSARGNLDFDEGGSTVDQCRGCAADGDSFEPPDEVKGDVARMILYMAVRYEGGDGRPDLEVNDSVGNGGRPAVGRLSELLEWNAADPPSEPEMERNDRIYEDWQHNRNPFIDHPEWADAIWN